MLADRPVHATLPVSDIDRARGFYEQTLGFIPEWVRPAGVMYSAGNGTRFLIFPSGGSSSGTHTQLGITVDDIEATARVLRERGVALEVYDFEGFDPETRIASFPTNRSAWIRDTEGNLLGLVQFIG